MIFTCIWQTGEIHPLLAVSGSWESQSEFYDAEEYLVVSSGESSEVCVVYHI